MNQTTMAPPLATAVSAEPARGWVRRTCGALLTLAVAIPLVALIAVGALLLSGYHPMVEHSDSMNPLIATGDIIWSERIPAAEARPGDVVTFTDPNRGGETITHRVESVRHRADGKLSFVTRGDANESSERWAVAHDGTVGRYAFGIPKLGYAAESVGRNAFVLIALAAATLLTLDFVRRLWRRPKPATT